MNRRWLTLLGAFLLALGWGFLFLGGSANSAFASGIAVGLLLTAGVSFLFAGEGLSFVGIEWYQFLGVGNASVGTLFALYQPWVVLETGISLRGVFVAGISILGGLGLIFIGFDFMRGPKYFDLSNYEKGSLLRG